MSNVLDLYYHAKQNDFREGYYKKWVDTYMKADIKDIEQYMQSSLNNYFMACRMLLERGGKEDYDLLEKQLLDNDQHKYNCALDYILTFNTGKKKHSYRVEEMLDSKDISVIKRALEMTTKHKLAFDSDKVCRVCEKHFSQLGCCCSLRYTRDFDSLFERILVLYKQAEKNQKECLANLLFDLSNEDRFDTVFDIFANDCYHKIRFIAVRLAIKHEKYHLLSRFCEEKDGHIRKLARRYVK